jgi:hypothetical protein
MEQHASITITTTTTTANIYGHVLDTAKQQMAERMNKRAAGD